MCTHFGLVPIFNCQSFLVCYPEMSTVVCYSSFHSFVTCFYSLLPVACFYLYLFRIFLFVFSLFHLLLFFLLSLWGGKMIGCFCRVRPHWVEVLFDVILLLFVFICLFPVVWSNLFLFAFSFLSMCKRVMMESSFWLRPQWVLLLSPIDNLIEAPCFFVLFFVF